MRFTSMYQSDRPELLSSVELARVDALIQSDGFFLLCLVVAFQGHKLVFLYYFNRTHVSSVVR